MKRSEMIDILSKEINGQIPNMSFWLDFGQISNVLLAAEKAGMLPPVVEDKYYSYNVANGKDPFSYCKWDKE